MDLNLSSIEDMLTTNADKLGLAVGYLGQYGRWYGTPWWKAQPIQRRALAIAKNAIRELIDLNYTLDLETILNRIFSVEGTHAWGKEFWIGALMYALGYYFPTAPLVNRNPTAFMDAGRNMMMGCLINIVAVGHGSPPTQPKMPEKMYDPEAINTPQETYGEYMPYQGVTAYG